MFKILNTKIKKLTAGLLTIVLLGVAWNYIWPLKPQLISSSLFCYILNPSGNKSISNQSNLPGFSLQIPCNWNASWQNIDYSGDGEMDYRLTIANPSGVERLNLFFYYFAAGCSDTSCYQDVAPTHTDISSKYLRIPGQDAFVNSYFGPVAHDINYHNYTTIDGVKKLPFPFGVGVTNHTGGGSRIIHAVGQKTTPADETLIMDEIIKSMTMVVTS